MKKLAFIFLCLAIGCASCSSDNEPTEPERDSSLPVMPVNLMVSLGNPKYNVLNYKGGFYEFKLGDPTLHEGTKLGCGGILVVHTFSATFGPFVAYDLYCTYEKNVCIWPREGGYKAICPMCQSEYDITNGIGNCTSGPNFGKTLQKYKASVYGRVITVTRD